MTAQTTAEPLFIESARSSLRAHQNARRFQYTPTVLQMEAVECGVASLAMILAFHGRWVPLEELRVACGVSRDGSKASNLLKAARIYGLAGKGFKKEPAQLVDLPVPSIIHWNFNHFVVFEGSHGGWASINDPAVGRRRVPASELSEAFTGVVLAFETTAQFDKGGAPPHALPFLWDALAGSRAGLALVALTTLTLVIPGIILPVFSKLFVDDVLIDGSREWIRPLLIGLATTAILRAFILIVRQHYQVKLESKLGVTMASRFFWHILRLPMAFFSQRHAGDIAARIATNEEVAKLLSGDLTAAALDMATLIFFAAAMAAYDFALAAISVAFALINLVALKLVSRSREDTARRLAQDRGQLAGATVGAIRSIETIKSSGLELDIFARWAGYHAKVLGAEQELDRQSNMLGIVPPLVSALGIAAVLGVGSLRVMDGIMSVGDLVAFQTLAASFAAPITRLIGLSAKVQEIKAGLARAADVLAHETDPRAERNRKSAATPKRARLSGEIELRDVTFGYNSNEPPLIEGFSLSVRPGQRVALVGSSGSGKSTLGRLICGLYQPWSGEIRFDGGSIANIPPEVLAHSLAYVDQDVVLFAGSVRENVTLWDPAVEEARVARALQEAAIFDEIALRPGVYDYMIGENGLNFSGGQRQRLEIARALVMEPSIVVLDEATAALDPLVEQQIDDNLRRRGCTCIIIAHRYSTIRDCDEILVLSGGRVIGRGTHDQLIDECPQYVQLLQTE
jgi:NHLM bacteriocin system ABC transporter peptidase/ATP-binding protein